MKKTALLLLCTLFHGVLWSQVGIYKIEGDLEVTGDTKLDGNVGVGEDSPDHEVHITKDVSPVLLIEASATQIYNGASIWLKTASTDPEMGVVAIDNHLLTGSGDASQFAIQKRAMNGDYKGNILVYRHDLDRWAISPAGVETLLISTNAVKSVTLVRAMEGLEVTNGVTTDSITLGGETLSTWSDIQATLYDGSGNYIVSQTSSVTGTTSSFIAGTNHSVTDISNFAIFGRDHNIDDAYESFIAGGSNQGVIVDSAAVFGAYNTMDDVYGAMVWGLSNQAAGQLVSVWGQGNQVEASYATVWGSGNIAKSSYSTVLGRYATYDNGHSESAWVDTEPLLLIGNGTNDTNRANALQLLKNGDMEISGTFEANGITLGGVTHTAWPVSVDTVNSNFDAGTNTYISSSFSSVVFGEDHELYDSDDISVWGKNHRFFMTGNATTWGENNLVYICDNSTAWGRENEVWGDDATLWGVTNITRANLSTVWGVENRLYSYLTTVFGRFATYDANHAQNNWVDVEPLLLIGNGVDDQNRSNALELLKNGNMTVSGTLKASKGVVLDNGAEATAGAVRWTGTDFEGYDGTAWVSLTTPPDTGNGDISMGPFN